MNFQYRRAHYVCSEHPYPQYLVIYIVYPGCQIVFTGFNAGKVMSTINAAEEVIVAIATKECIDPREFEFYDLQTHEGYAGFEPGDYTFNQLQPQWGDDPIRPTGMFWREGHCNNKVLEHFMGYIVGSDSQIPLRNIPVAWGILKEHTEPDPNTFQELIDLSMVYQQINENRKDLEMDRKFMTLLKETSQMFCLNHNIDSTAEDVFQTLMRVPRDLPLGEAATEKFYELCEFLLDNDPRFYTRIKMKMFFA